ncbi:MAG: exopolysaccharide biosynthesis polyprenyl glycosylphosphotransferase [Hyphomonadaceae bacterium]|nr:exopolysaccharide biosynthesis polyprenyl glycosylphosphotransferase [Hyphomonadaceae bacterium]
MSQPALKCVGAELGQSAGLDFPAPASDSAPTAEVEAQKMADLAASFCLFGLRIMLDEAALASAEEAYRTPPEADAPAPANDTAPAFPPLRQRALHIDPTLPVKLTQAIDWLFVLLVAELAALWGAGGGLAYLSISQAFGFLATALCLKAGFWITDAYRFTPGRVGAERAMGGAALGAVIGLAASALLAPDARSAAALAATLPLAALLLAGIHAALALWIRAAPKAGAFAETIVLIGATPTAERLVARATKSGEARIIAIADDRCARSPAQVAGAPVAGNVEALLAWEGLPHVDRIVITVTQKAEARVRAIIERLRVAPNRVDLLLDYQTLSVRGAGVERLGGAGVACVSGRPRNYGRALTKRTQDVIFGSALLALFALPMLIIAAAIKFDSRGPVFYRQQRHGFNNRIITVLKFRSMKHDPGAPLAQVQSGDPRITRVGAWLRRTSLDELPQLFNVLKGEMSLVGPRPHAVGMKTADRELNQIVAEYAQRHCVKPGLTGWAQVNGSRGPVHTAQALRRRVQLDLEYVAKASFWLDVQILLRTAPALLGDAKVTR